MGTIKSIKRAFGGGDSRDQAAAIAAAAQTQADTIRAEGERQTQLAKEQAAIQTKQLQDQQVASNMALQQSMNQRALSQQLEAETPAPEPETKVDLAAATAPDASDPRRKFQRGGAASSIKIA